MSPTIEVAAIAAFPGILAAILGWINKRKITEVHLTMNSRLDQLLEVTRKAAFAAGQKDQLGKTQ